MMSAFITAWFVLCIVGACVFIFGTQEEPESVEPGPNHDDLMLIEYQARGRRESFLHGESGSPGLLKCVDIAVKEAVKIRIAE